MTYRFTYSYEISLYVLTPVYKLGIQVKTKPQDMCLSWRYDMKWTHVWTIAPATDDQQPSTN